MVTWLYEMLAHERDPVLLGLAVLAACAGAFSVQHALVRQSEATGAARNRGGVYS